MGSVFLVHGRNNHANDAMRQFLRALGLQVLEWSEAKSRTRGTNPYIGDILETGFRLTKATVVLLTPDEIAFLRSPFRKPGDGPENTGPVKQSRPNVLYELGWAMKGHRNRTIIVRLGEGRLPSDVIGRHYIEFNGSPESRKDLVSELGKVKGLTINTAGLDWLRSGDFDAVLKRESLDSPKHQWIPAGVSVSQSIFKYSNVIDAYCHRLILTGTNFGDVLGERADPPSTLHNLIIMALKGVNKPTVTIAFAPPELLKAVNPTGFQDLVKYSMPRMLDLYHSSDLTSEERNRLSIISHAGALFAALFIRDPEHDDRGLIVATPRWISDTQGIGRMYFAVHKADNPDIFEALYRPIDSDLRVNESRKDLLDIAKEYNVT